MYWNGACVCTSLQSVGGQHVEINILCVIYLLLMFLFVLHHHAVIVPVYVSTSQWKFPLQESRGHCGGRY